MAGESVQLPVLRQGLTPGNVDQYNYEEIHKSLDQIDPYPLDVAAATYGNAREAFAKSQSCIVDCAKKLAGAWSGDSADEAWRQLSQLHDAANVLATHSDTMQAALYATSGSIAAGKADMQSTYQPSTDTTGYSAAVASPGLANRKASMDAQARKQLAQINSDIDNSTSKAPTNITFTLPNRKNDQVPYAGAPTGSGGADAGGGAAGPRGSGGGSGSRYLSPGGPGGLGGSHLQGGQASSSGGMVPGGRPGRDLGSGGSPSPGDSSGFGVPYGSGSLGANASLGLGAEVGKGLGSGGLGAEEFASRLGKGGIVGSESASATADGTLPGQVAEARGAAALEAGVLGGTGGMGMPIVGGVPASEGSNVRSPSSWLFEEDDVWADQRDVAPPVIE